LSEMDEAGIDVQILSHGAPSAQKLSGTDAVDITRRVNDRLHAIVAANPKRFAAFAALPTTIPKPRPTNSNAPPSSASRER
jgi:predicted TIM-barrel fold metal-dependent hydrolase